MELSARAQLKKPTYLEEADINIVNDNMDLLDLYAVGDFICTSATRPAAPWQGMRIYETDTGARLVRVGANWRPEGPIICTSGTRPANVLNGQQIFETDTHLFAIKDSGVPGGWVYVDGTYQTWVPVITTGTLGTNGTAQGVYSRIGRVVIWAVDFTFGAGAASSNAMHLISLPTYAIQSSVGSGYVYNGAFQNMQCQNVGTAQFRAVNGANYWGNAYAPIASGNSAAFSGSYIAS